MLRPIRPAIVLIVLMSLLLQYGCAIATINHAMKRNPDGSPASPLGRAAVLIHHATQPGE